LSASETTSSLPGSTLPQPTTMLVKSNNPFGL
jgi:hypothetical protein